jgi:hypothetical protein
MAENRVAKSAEFFFIELKNVKEIKSLSRNASNLLHLSASSKN